MSLTTYPLAPSFPNYFTDDYHDDDKDDDGDNEDNYCIHTHNDAGYRLGIILKLLHHVSFRSHNTKIL